MGNGGDVLARGGSRCQFPPAGGRISQERWDAMWAPEVTDEPEDSRRDADVKTDGDASPQSGSAVSDATGFPA